MFLASRQQRSASARYLHVRRRHVDDVRLLRLDPVPLDALRRLRRPVRPNDISGWAKAGWTVFVIILPFLGIFVYLISQGKGMGERAQQRAQAQQAEVDTSCFPQYARSPALGERGRDRGHYRVGGGCLDVLVFVVRCSCFTETIRPTSSTSHGLQQAGLPGRRVASSCGPDTSLEPLRFGARASRRECRRGAATCRAARRGLARFTLLVRSSHSRQTQSLSCLSSALSAAGTKGHAERRTRLTAWSSTP